MLAGDIDEGKLVSHALLCLLSKLFGESGIVDESFDGGRES